VLRRREPVIARGLGRSYGDAAQCAGGTVIDLTSCRRVIEHDPDRGIVRAESGLSIDELLRWSVPRGWFVPVTPGTRQVTLGGALAADVHGKNHHRDGSFAKWVRRAHVATPTGRRTISAEEDGPLFWATAGGMGLTGVILDLTVQLVAIESSMMLVDTERADDLDDCMARMEAADHAYRYSVAWVDCLARGAHLGRGVLTRGDHAALVELAGARAPEGAERLDGGDARRATSPVQAGRAGRRGGRAADPLGFSPRQLLAVPVAPPFRPLTRQTVAAFNEAWFRRAPKHRAGELQRLSTFFHPLDGLGNWNLLYGRPGFTQYQFVVPFGQEEVVRHVIESLSRAGLPSFLAVLKRFGPGDGGPLSFPISGWTLAVDVPLGAACLPLLLDEFDERVAGAGGRVYLAKDSRLRPELLAMMYPRLSEWQEVCSQVDPDGLMTSDLARRLWPARRGGSRRASGAGSGAPSEAGETP
jgi:decaprenylphospho-beta-D-ribofuranose 2-oxidase